MAVGAWRLQIRTQVEAGEDERGVDGRLIKSRASAKFAMEGLNDAFETVSKFKLPLTDDTLESLLCGGHCTSQLA